MGSQLEQGASLTLTPCAGCPLRERPLAEAAASGAAGAGFSADPAPTSFVAGSRWDPLCARLHSLLLCRVPPVPQACVAGLLQSAWVSCVACAMLTGSHPAALCRYDMMMQAFGGEGYRVSSHSEVSAQNLTG